MNRQPTRTDVPSNHFISENAVRAVFDPRRPSSPTAPAHNGNRMPAHSREDSSGPAGGARRLRRWSVAELIARAAPPPSTT